MMLGALKARGESAVGGVCHSLSNVREQAYQRHIKDKKELARGKGKPKNLKGRYLPGKKRSRSREHPGGSKGKERHRDEQKRKHKGNMSMPSINKYHIVFT